AGTAYFDKQNAVQSENKARELARLALEEKITPEVGRSGLGSGSMPGYVSVIGQDGKRYMVNRLNPNDRIEIGTGVNQGALHDAADRYAREQIKDSIFKDDAEREARYNYHKQQYIDRRVNQRPDDRSMFPDVPGRVTGGPDQPVDTSRKVILDPAEQEQQRKIGMAEGDEYTSIVQSGANSRGQLSTLDFLESNFDKITTGKLTPALTEIKSW
ncbi:hypothetical protein RZS08_11175, partial [Arthrospira platensis SPKY1]|nr:hypothetical protein [Arthrospira platensis SPKY1]